MASEFPYPHTQPLEVSDDEEIEQQPDERMDDHAAKTLMYLPMDDCPDLYDYFSQYDFTIDEQIRYCRSFASTLAAQTPQKRRKRSPK